jgi:hypothetical protein
MDRRMWERLGASTGILGVVSLVVGQLIVGAQPPRVDTPLPQAIAYYTQHRSALLWQAWLAGIGVAFFLWFAGSVRHTLWKAEGDTGRLANVAFGGAIGASVLFMVPILFSTTIAYNLTTLMATPAGRALGTSEVALTGSMAQLAYTFVWFPVAVFLGATSIVVIRNKALPSSLGIFGIPLAIASLAGAATYRSAGAATPGGTLGQGLFFVVLAWVLALSVTLVAQTGTRAEPKTIYLDQPQRERLMEQEEMRAG